MGEQTENSRDYELLLNEIINIGKEMIKSGAETDRAEDSMYRMLESYDLEQCSVFAIQSDIQATIKPKGGHFITQIRRIHRTGFNYDRLDYLNNLSRQICMDTPSVEEIRKKYDEVMNRKPLPWYLQFVAPILGGVGFGVYFGCDWLDTIVGVIICGVIEVYLGNMLSKKEDNLVVYNLIIAFLSAAAVLLAAVATLVLAGLALGSRLAGFSRLGGRLILACEQADQGLHQALEQARLGHRLGRLDRCFGVLRCGLLGSDGLDCCFLADQGAGRADRLGFFVLDGGHFVAGLAGNQFGAVIAQTLDFEMRGF